MATKPKKVKRKVEVVSVTIYCPKLKRRVAIPKDRTSWSWYESPCGMCGTHGSLTLDVTCKCGGQHTIEVEGY